MLSVIRSGQSWLLREPLKELENSEVKFKRGQGEERKHKKEDNNYFMNEKEDICEMKMINDLYQKFVNPVARQIRSPDVDRPTRSIRILVVHEGLVGGARE